VLREYPGVRDALVLVAGDGAQRHLIGYVTPADGVELAALRPELLRPFLARRLPGYLVPAGLRALGRFPLNANGKVDRAALPAAELPPGGPVTPPRGGTEQRLASIWQPLLPAGVRASDVGRQDSFFTLGGNSLSAARLMFRIREAFGVDLPMATFYEAPTLAACAAAIDAGRPAGSPAPDPGQPAAASPTSASTVPARIGRRDRSAYRVGAVPATAPARPAVPGPHLVRLTDDWALWRTVCLRGAGFGVGFLDALADPDLARAADAVLAADPGAREQAEAAYAAGFTAATGRLSAALYDAAVDPALREAVTWQNAHGLKTGLDSLVRHGRRPAKRNAQHRQHEALVASYVQRYCAKNDTIGFFGPVGWSRIDDGAGVRVTHPEPGRLLSGRVTYLEGWAVRGVMASHEPALRPWLVPRRMPFVGIDGTRLWLPLTPPIPLTPSEAAVLRVVDGRRTAREVAAAVTADPAAGLSDHTEVFALLERLAASRRVAWQIDVPPQEIWPERAMRTLLGRVTDDGIREPAEKSLAQLIAARDELAAAAGDAERVAAAMSGLEATFTQLSGLPPTRRAGELYAGRTLALEECLRADTVRLGQDTLDGLREPLALVLDSARWFAAACGQLYADHFDAAYRQRAAALGTDVVPFADLWLLCNEALFDQPPKLVEPAAAAVRQRWAEILRLPPDAHRVQLRAADLRDRVSATFPARPLPWPTATHHSPDLMIAGVDAAAGGRITWVLGEVHPSNVTTRYATWLAFHEDTGAVRAALRRDLGRATVWLATTAELGGISTRLSNVLPSPDDLRLVYAHDSCGYDPASTVTVGECEVVSSPAGLRVRRRDGSFERGLLEVIGDLVSSEIANAFDLIPPGAHTPRVTIDDLVVQRETWTVPAGEPAFARTTDESARYLQARAWAAGLGLPRHVFMRFTGERKPIYADLTSLASVQLVARSLRRAHREAGAEATVKISEMLPAPDEAWLTDAQGQRYTAELRIVAADQKMAWKKEG
jgi:acyl carrier protein